MGMAMLPIGVALAILVILRIVLIAADWESLDALDVFWVLINGAIAVHFVFLDGARVSARGCLKLRHYRRPWSVDDSAHLG